MEENIKNRSEIQNHTMNNWIQLSLEKLIVTEPKNDNVFQQNCLVEDKFCIC